MMPNSPIPHLDRPFAKKKVEMVEKYPLPTHWQTPSLSRPLGSLRYIIFTTLCLCAYGQLNLESLWATLKLDRNEGDPRAWKEGQHRMCDQLNNVLVLV